MSKKKETDPKICVICGKEFQRRRWKNRDEDIQRYENRDVCDDPECYKANQSYIMKKVHAKKKFMNRSITEVFLSRRWLNLNTVRYNNKEKR